jgi:iron complex transport system ATP-binding protein
VTALPPALALAGVDLVEGDTPVLHGVDWVAGADERWVVVGPNGSGKTSLLRLVSFQRGPTHGTVTVLGDTFGQVDVREARRRIGFGSTALLQRLRPSLSAHDAVLTGREAALEPWWHHYTDTDHQRADALLELVGCGDHTTQDIGSLSEGERKRLLVARVLMADPQLLLFDEPCAGLDLGGRESLVALLGALADAPDARPMVMVTHHLEEIPPGFTHALLLRAGRVVSCGEIGHALTSETVSDAFDLDVTVSFDDGRWSARVVPGESPTARERSGG